MPTYVWVVDGNGWLIVENVTNKNATTPTVIGTARTKAAAQKIVASLNQAGA